MGKNSFVIYKSWSPLFRNLKREQAGEMLQIMMAYQDGEDVSPEDETVAVIFSMVKTEMDKDDEKYKETCKSRAEQGRKGGLAKGGKRKQKEAIAKNNSKSKQNLPDTDTDTDTDNNPPKSPLGKKGLSATELIEQRGFPEQLEEAVKDWTRYKAEKKQGYKATGFKNLLAEIASNAEKHGQSAVVDVIRKSIAANYTGIVWAWLNDPRGSPGKSFDNKRDYDFAAIEKQLLEGG